MISMFIEGIKEGLITRFNKIGNIMQILDRCEVIEQSTCYNLKYF